MHQTSNTEPEINNNGQAAVPALAPRRLVAPLKIRGKAAVVPFAWQGSETSVKLGALVSVILLYEARPPYASISSASTFSLLRSSVAAVTLLRKQPHSFNHIQSLASAAVLASLKLPKASFTTSSTFLVSTRLPVDTTQLVSSSTTSLDLRVSPEDKEAL